MWPRGFPLQFINNPATYNVPPSSPVAKETLHLAAVQSLADHDPDVDTVYRLTRKLPVYFDRKNTIVVPPQETFVPWNAQAVVVRQPAFFGLFLPVTVTGRVTDIWCSYIISRLFWETA